MIRKTLRDLPVGLVQTYERILLKISRSPLAKQEIALRVFQWTVCSRRPLKAEELQEAVAFERSDVSWDRDKIPDENLMIETCRGLLVRDEDDRTVRFAHHTVQQYLLSAPMINTQEGSHFLIPPRFEAEAFVGHVCVTYLCFSDFETQVALRTPNVHLESLGVLQPGGPIRIPSVLGIGKSLLEIPYRLLGGKPTKVPLNIEYNKYLAPDIRTKPQVSSGLMEKYRLLEYIIEYWMDHTRNPDHDLDAQFRHLVMYKTLSFEFRPWGINQHFGPYGCASCPDPKEAKELPFMSLFHYAAQAGHWSLMKSLVTEYCRHEVPLNETLLIACRHGQDLIVRNLMQRNNFDISDGRAINIAIATGHADMLKYLMDLSIEWKSSPYDIVTNASSMLNLAATNGHEEVVDTIFTYCHSLSADHFEESVYINEKDETTGRTALFSVVMSGHENIIRNLLRRGAQIRAYGNTAIHIAAEYGHVEILRMLLDFASKHIESDDDGEINNIEYEDGTRQTYPHTLLRFFDTDGDTPLHKAARNGNAAIIEVILRHRPRFESRTMKTRYTALHLAAEGGHLDVLKILIDGGASIEAEDHDFGWRPLHLAAANGHEAVVLFLVHNGASHAATKDGRTILELAVSGGHDAIVRELLKNKWPGLNSSGEIVALVIIAAKEGKESILRALLEYSDNFVDPTEQKCLKAALHAAKSGKHDGAVALLNSLLQEDPLHSWNPARGKISALSGT